MGRMSGCKCHGATFCPDLICVDFEDDVPIFARRDSPEGREAERRMRELLEQTERREYERLKAKFEQESR